MQIFYAPDITEDYYILNPNESKHIIRVLRMAKGSELMLIDGKGNLYNGIIDNPDQTKCGIQIIRKTTDYEKRSYRLHIAISPLKNPERFEWFIEKSVEIGIDEITPVICRNTEKPGIKYERIENIIISAMKQSLKATKPVLNEPVSFMDFIKDKRPGLHLLAHCDASLKRHRLADIYQPNSDVTIMIGPEGDFTSEEIELAGKNGFQSIHLGTSRLRTETAGIAACHSVYFVNQL
jgi:16S rRNA (uracil1498-N3)-methyltransferase